MRFAALFVKEFRECLPWMLLAAIVLLTFGGFTLRMQADRINWQWSRGYSSPGAAIEPYRLSFQSPLGSVGPWLFCCSIGLGLILGVRQFWMPNVTRTWPFLLHRSIRRSTALIAKLGAAATALAVPIGGIWVGLFQYACRPDLFGMPEPPRILVEGWIFVVLGFVAYLGTALSGLSEARWYTTKIFGIAFAAIVVFTTTMQCSLGWALVVIAFSTALLLSQLFDAFATREF